MRYYYPGEDGWAGGARGIEWLAEWPPLGEIEPYGGCSEVLTPKVLCRFLQSLFIWAGAGLWRLSLLSLVMSCRNIA